MDGLPIFSKSTISSVRVMESLMEISVELTRARNAGSATSAVARVVAIANKAAFLKNLFLRSIVLPVFMKLFFLQPKINFLLHILNYSVAVKFIVFSDCVFCFVKQFACRFQ